jgi:hypothetical protein
MNLYKTIRWIILPALLSVFLLGCDDTAIFYTLEGVYPIDKDLGLTNNIAVFEIVGTGTKFFAAAGTLYARGSSNDNWQSVSSPVTGASCDTIEIFGGLLYAGFYKKDGTGLGLYRTNPATIDWTADPITAAEVQNKQIGMIKEVGATLYVTTAEWNDTDKEFEYFLYSTADGDTYTPAVFDIAPTAPVTDIEDYVGAFTYWVIAGDDLYADTAANLNNLTLQNPVPALPALPVEPQTSSSFGGLLDSTVSAGLYLSAKDGKLWRYDGSDWDDTRTVTIDGTGVLFTRFIDDTRNNVVLVGTEGAGYYKIDPGLPEPLENAGVQRLPSPTLDLYKSAINSFYIDVAPDPDILFACTYGSGLWREEYVDEDSRWYWKQE